MAGLSITITDAGRAALINAQHTGVSNVLIDRIGVSSVHAPGALKGLTTLPNERKRLDTFAGDVVASDLLHVAIRDETAEVYSLRSFGLYLSSGALFAVYSSPDVIMEKSAGAMVLLAVDIAMKTLDTAQIQFGGTGFINPPATTERQGVVRLSTTEEAAAGARSDVAVTPLSLMRTLQSWAGNFANAVHRHAMASIDGLTEALSGKADKVHKHDAADTTTGVFDVGRIPAIAMEKITGLATALAGKAASVHGHAISEITGLVVALQDKAAAVHGHAISSIDGLTEALSGKADKVHKHDAADTTTGVFDVGRIPAIAMEKVTGLATALAGKAAAVHTHAISEITGLSAALQDKASALHSHTMAQVSGLVDALAGKASVVHRHDWSQIDDRPNLATVEYVVGRAASSVEAQAGALSDKFITPNALWSFARSIGGTTGYAVLPGSGLVLQWGVSTITISEGQAHAMLPVAFGGGCLVALANPRNPYSNRNSDWYMQVVSRHLDRIVFYANRANDSAGNLDGYEWLALGRASGAPDPAYSTGGNPGGGWGGGGEFPPDI